MDGDLKDIDYENKKLKAGFLGQRMIVIPENIREVIRKNALIQALYITDIGFFPSAQNHYRERKKGAKEHILIYCLEGSGIIEIFDQKLELVSNSYYIIPPDTAHGYSAVKKNPWSIYWMHFKGRQSNFIYQKFCDRRAPKIVQIPLIERRIALFENYINVLEEGYSSDNIEYVNLSLWELFCSFIYSNYFAGIGKNRLSLIDSSIKFMRENLDKVISVKELAEQFNYSSSHFVRLFKNKTGYSPIHYFNHLKIQKACQFLSFTDLSVKEISFELGFDDPLYFSRLFKKSMYMSPLKYRNKYKD